MYLGQLRSCSVGSRSAVCDIVFRGVEVCSAGVRRQPCILRLSARACSRGACADWRASSPACSSSARCVVCGLAAQMACMLNSQGCMCLPVAPPGFCNRRGSEVWVYRGSSEYEVPQSRLYCLCINVALCSTAVVYLSCDTKKFHDNESTHILHNFWTSTHRELVAWHSGRTSVSDWRTFPVLRSTCS